MAVLPPDPIYTIKGNDMGPINCVCFHNDERLLCGTTKGNIYLWDLQTNRSLLHFAMNSESDKQITYLSHIQESLICQQRDGVLKSFDLSNTGYTLTNSFVTNYLGFCRCECVPEQDMIISPYEHNSICILNRTDWKIDRTLHLPNDHNLGNLMCIKYIIIAGQPYLLAAYENCTFLTWDLRYNRIINEQKIDELDCPISFDFNAETNRGIVGGPGNKLAVFSFKRNTLEMVQESGILIKNPSISCVRIRKDSKVFSTGGADGRIRIFSWKSLRPLAVLTEHKGEITDIAYSVGKVSLWNAPIMATAAMDGQVALWDLYN